MLFEVIRDKEIFEPSEDDVRDLRGFIPVALGLLWGVIPLTVDFAATEDPHVLGRKTVIDLGIASKGDIILVVRGFSTEPEENAPSVTVVTV